MRIGLYGILGVYNFGCEAIVRGAYKYIKNIYPDSEICYFSYSYDYDKNALSDLDIEIYKMEYNRNFVLRCINKALSLCWSEYRILNYNFNKIMDKVDMIFSIGGDIYTIPAVLREKNTYPYYNSLVNFCNRAIDAGKKVIVYGASVGPFGNYKKAVDYYVTNMKKYDAIICREMETVEYLKSLGLENTSFLPDPAFQVKGEGINNCEKKYIGVNLSPLSLIEIYGNCSAESIHKMAVLLDQIYEQFEIDLLFVPHVLSQNESDNDLVFLEKVKAEMKIENQKHIKFADYTGGFLGVKKQLRECHMVISARMHCAINAICENVPTIFLSYSQKSIGMCQYVYGTKEWLVDLRKLEESLLQKMEEEIVEKLKGRNDDIQKEYELYISDKEGRKNKC